MNNVGSIAPITVKGERWLGVAVQLCDAPRPRSLDGTCCHAVSSIYTIATLDVAVCMSFNLLHATYFLHAATVSIIAKCGLLLPVKGPVYGLTITSCLSQLYMRSDQIPQFSYLITSRERQAILCVTHNKLRHFLQGPCLHTPCLCLPIIKCNHQLSGCSYVSPTTAGP